MAATLVRKVMLKIAADDGDTEEKLSRIKEKADELGRLHPDIKVKIDSAAASAKMAVLRRELKDTGNQSQESGGKLSDFGRAVNALTFGLSGGWGEMTMFQKAMAAANIATGIGEPLIAGLTVAAGGLAAGVVSAVAGLGVFGLVAKAVYSKVSTAITAYTTAQTAATNATTKSARTAALKQEATAFDGLTASQRRFATGITQAKTEWNRFVSAASPGVIATMTAGLRLLPDGLRLMKPFLSSIEPALQMITGELHTALNSSWVKSFFGTMATFSGPAFAGLATAIGNVAKGVAGILKAFVPVSGGIIAGLDKMTAKFANWGQTLTGHSGFQDLMKMFRSDTPLAISTLKNLAGIIKTVGGEMTGMSTFGNSKMFLQVANSVTSLVNSLLKAHPELVWLILYAKMGGDAFGKLRSAISGIGTGVNGIKNVASAAGNLKNGFSDAEVAASDASGVMGTFGGKLSSMVSAIGKWGIGSKIAAAATKVWTGVQAAFDVVMDANPIALVVIGIAALIAIIVVCVIKFQVFRNFFKDLWRDIKQWTADGVNFIKAHWEILPAIFLGPLGLVVALVIKHFSAIKNAAGAAISGVISFFRALPGRIVGAVGNLGRLLFGAGQDLLRGLLGGIESMVGDVVGAAEGVGKSILGGLKDALGIFSPSREGMKLMNWLGAGLRQGLDGMKGSVAEGGSRVAAAIAAAIHDGLLSAKTGKSLQSALLTQMKNARAYSQQISSSAVSGYDITSMTNPAGTAVTSASGILGGLKIDLGQIRAFTRNMKKLGREGLSKQLLRQLFAAGPIQGGPVAAALAGAGLDEIRQITREENQIQSWSAKLGAVGAQSVYGGQAGVQRVLLDIKAGGGGNGLEQMFRTWLKESIRKHGGDPNVLGR